MVAKQQKKKQSKFLFLSIASLACVLIAGAILFKANFFMSQQPNAQTYSGTLPCADCSGLITTLTLLKQIPEAKQGTFILHELYEGKSTQPFVSEGTWTISKGAPNNSEATILTLSTNGNISYYLMEGKDQLQLLDQNKQKIDSPFTETLTLQGKTPAKNKPTQLANPASINCTQKGGTLVMQTRGDGGQYGLCQFEDNQACEEWALYRGDCPVGGIKTTGFDTVPQQYCAWVGGQTLAVPNAVCNLPSGNICQDDALYNGTCQTN